ncbi:MAG: MFS transporter [Anaerolineae bacterium]|nr:MFS transporter [Anaerolineae bacterium]
MTGEAQRRKPIGPRLNRWLVSGAGSTLVLTILFLHMLLLGMTQLVAPLYSLALGASQVVLGVVVGAFGVAGILLSILSSVLSDYLGRRQMISVSFVFWIGAGAVSLSAPPFLWLVWGQVLAGVADLCLWVAAMTYLTEITPQGKHAEILSLGTGLMGLGLIVGPALGGLIGRFIGFQPAFTLVVLLGILGLILSYKLPNTKLPTAERGAFLKQLFLSHRGAFVLVRRNRPMRMAILVMMLGTAGWMAVGRSFYLAYLNHLGFSTEVIGLLTTLRASAMTLAQFGFAFLANHLGAVVTTLSGLAIGGLALTLTPFLTTAPILALVGCLGSGADRLRIPGMFTMIAEGTDQDSRGLAVALLNVAWAATNTVLPPVLGMIVERTALSVSFLLVGPLVAISSILLYVWNQRVASELSGPRKI